MINPWMIIAASVALSLAFGAGMYTHQKFVMADKLKEVEAEHQKYKAAVDDERKRDKELYDTLSSRLQTTKEHAENVERKLELYLQDSPANEPSIGLVGLWNDAVTGKSLSETSGLSLAESEKPSGLAHSEFVKAGFHCVSAYNELKDRYNAFVTWAENEGEQTD